MTVSLKNDREIHQIIETSHGTHILIFLWNGTEYLFDSKIFVSESEYRHGED